MDIIRLIKLLFFLLCFLPLDTSAQAFPYSESFEGILSGTLPVGWSGDMQAKSDHGINDTKGMVASLSGANIEDSAITSWIGPLNAQTQFYFWYRIVDQYIYPSTETHLSGGDFFTISYSTDSLHYSTLFSIDSTNHIPSLNFRKITFPITNLNGQIVKFKFYTHYSAGNPYFVDIDSFQVRTDPTSDVPTLMHPADFTCFPNPVKRNSSIILHFSNEETHLLYLYSSTRQFIRSITCYRSGSLPVADLPAGLYFLQSGTTVKKVLILPDE